MSFELATPNAQTLDADLADAWAALRLIRAGDTRHDVVYRLALRGWFDTTANRLGLGESFEVPEDLHDAWTSSVHAHLASAMITRGKAIVPANDGQHVYQIGARRSPMETT